MTSSVLSSVIHLGDAPVLSPRFALLHSTFDRAMLPAVAPVRT